MTILSQIAGQRNAYFALKPSELVYHLLMQNVPVLPVLANPARDLVNDLYVKLRIANDKDLDYRYSEHLTALYASKIKTADKIAQSKPEKCLIINSVFDLPVYKIYFYDDTEEILVRRYHPLDLGEVVINFRFYIFANTFEFLKFEFANNANFRKYPLLGELSDSINFDFLIMNEYIDRSMSKDNVSVVF